MAAKAHGNEDWVGVQKRTFTRWANSYLAKRKAEINDLAVDFQDGTKLAALLEIISNERLPKVNPTPKIEIQKLENLNKCLQFLKEKEIQLVNIGSQDIFKGNEKLILGLLWTIILRFEVGDQDGKNGLLLWVQRTCKGYAHVDPPNVQNFTSDWNSGLPFCAIIHRYRPDLLSYDGLRPANAEHNCELAFSVAADKLGIPRLLDVADVANNPRPDEKSIIAYVIQFFKLFAKASKNDALLKSIKNAVEVTKRHDAWIGKYEGSAQDLTQWAGDFSSKLLAPSTATTTAQVKKELDGFTQYMRNEKPKRQAMRAELEGIANQLVTSKRNNKRPAFEPAVSVEVIAGRWDALELAEREHEQQLLDKYDRFQQVDNEVAKFEGRASTVQKWLEDKSIVFSKGVAKGASLTALESELEAHDFFETRLGQHREVLAELEGNANRVAELGRGEHEKSQSVAKQMSDIASAVELVTRAGETHKSALEQAIEAEKEAVVLERTFKREWDMCDFEADQVLVRAREAIVVSSAKDVASLKEELQKSRASASALRGKVDAELSPLAQKLVARRGEVKKQVDDLVGKVQAIEGALKTREETLTKKLAEESKRDELREKFAKAANALGAAFKKVSESLANVKGALEMQLEQVRAIRDKVTGELKTDLDKADAIAVQCDEAGIVSNPNTTYTIFSLAAEHDQLTKACNDQEQSINAQIFAKKQLEVSPDQIRELQEVFAYFDSGNNGFIELKELKEACTGAGIDLAEDEIERRMKAKSSSMKFTLDDFTDFMIAEMKAGDDVEHVLGAFKQLGEGSESLTPAQIDSAFGSEPELKAYISQNMKDGNIGAFVSSLFSR